MAGSPGSERETLFSDDGMVGNPTASAFWGIWGTSPSNVFAVGSGGTILRYTGTAWSAMHSITTSHLYGVWGSSDSNVFAVGDNGTILRYNGRTWSTMNSTTTSHLYGVWGSSDSNVFAVGSGGTILHHNGNTWSTMDSMTMSHLYGVWGNSDSSVFAVGENGTILHYTGTVWSAMDSTTMSHLYGVWGDSDSSVFAVGENGTILHYIGTVWSAMDSMVIGHLYGVWGSSSADVFAVGGDGVILHYTGTWSATVSGTTSYLRGVWGSSPDIFAVGESGTLLHSDGGAWERASFGNGFSLMPYLTVAGKFITWADVATITHSLKDGYLPFPEVEWHYQGLCFSQRVFPYAADVGDSYNYISYTLKNTGTTTISDRLYLTIRPFQVRPPWMYGGLQEITSIEREGDNRFRINGNRGLVAITPPNGFGAVADEDGEILDYIARGEIPTRTSVLSGTYASAVLVYAYTLGAGKEQNFVFAIPMDRGIDDSDLPLTMTETLSAYRESKAAWKEILDRIEIDIPDRDVVNTLKANIAYGIVQQDGKAFQPGSDNYDRSWMRDGAEIGMALLRTGNYTAVRDYLEWMAGFQGPDGLIPPIIRSEGYIDDRDRFNEWDSQGEFIFLVSEYYKFTQDRAFLKQTFPNVVKALEFLKNHRDPDPNPRFHGILLPSICHEGYPKPVHCYWDDFWALKGWQEAREMAVELERYDLIPQIDKEYQDFSNCLVNSIKRTRSELCIEYIPGSADDGDFDATSTAVSVWPTEQTDLLKEGGLLPALEYTLDKYYQETFLPRLEQGLQFGYTPYEMRTAIAYLMLGQKDKALEMLNYFLKDRRPLEWNHWAEVVHPGYRDPEYIGDMPHSWIGAIYINLVRSLFVYEKDEELIFGSGIDEKWLEEQEQIKIDGFPTYFGDIGYTLSSQGDVLTVNFSMTNTNTEQGFVFKSPFSNKVIVSVKIDGQDWDRFTHDEIYFDEIPEEIIVTFATSRTYLPVVLKNYYPTVALLTHHGRYVTAMDVCPLLKQEPNLRDCGRFILQHLADGKVALVTCHNKYVTAPKTGTTDWDWALRQEPELSDCGRFTLQDLGGGKLAFETCAHRYFTALDGNRPLETQWLIIAAAPQVGDWERFTLQYQ